ncbi:MAG: HAMP domain-containing sensor histidine kinase [Methylococcaceae bacterium]
MASGIAHELNQPLAAIASYTEACLNFMKAEQMDMVKIRDTCIKVHQQSLRAGQIIHGMRDFVKYKSVRRETMEVNKLIHDSVNLCTSDLKLNAINLCLDLRPEPLFVHVDNIQIEQVIINLIKNSIDALHKIPWITPRQLSIQTKLNEQHNVEIRIKDNGLGINDKEKANILTPFFTTKPDGMGMGLSISHSIIKAHEGTMHFHSKIGKGTTFYFTLPQQ